MSLLLGTTFYDFVEILRLSDSWRKKKLAPRLWLDGSFPDCLFRLPRSRLTRVHIDALSLGWFLKLLQLKNVGRENSASCSSCRDNWSQESCSCFLSLHMEQEVVSVQILSFLLSFYPSILFPTSGLSPLRLQTKAKLHKTNTDSFNPSVLSSTLGPRKLLLKLLSTKMHQSPICNYSGRLNPHCA